MTARVISIKDAAERRKKSGREAIKAHYDFLIERASTAFRDATDFSAAHGLAAEEEAARRQEKELARKRDDLADWLDRDICDEDVALVDAIAKAIRERPHSVPTGGLWMALYDWRKWRNRRDGVRKARATRTTKKRKAAAEAKKRDT